MLCDRCHKNEATVHLHQVEDGKVRKLHLCEECCAELGLDLESPVSVADVMLGMGVSSSPERKEGKRVKCPRCGLSASAFKKNGRLGCPRCYETFEKEVLQLVRALHRHDRHVGKIPRRSRSALPRQASLEDLREALRKAVAEERYEEAARLRDLINEYEKGQASTTSA
ncbi:MAG: excinuclease ABC subunit B [Verrucomicrobia bacterium]|nr:MAG: excinuclease ABC subunit B [Verrucomicrobiota bacterium]